MQTTYVDAATAPLVNNGQVKLHGAADFAAMRKAGRLAAEALDMLVPMVQPGVTTEELDDAVLAFAREHDAIPAPLNYRGFPKAICTSINHVVCHGIPGEKRLKAGDIVNIDVTVIKDGYHGDTSKMFFVGEPTVAALRLARISHECMVKGISMVKPGVRLGDIGRRYRNMPRQTIVQSCANTAGTASARVSTRIRRSCTTAGAVPAWSCARA